MKKLDELLTLVILLMATGCTSPLVVINRTSPMFQSDINVQGNDTNVEGLPL